MVLFGRLPKPNPFSMSLTKEDVEVIKKLITDNNEVLEAKFETKFEKLLAHNNEVLEARLNSKFEAKLDAKFDPIGRLFKQVLSAQLEIVDDLELLEGNVKLIMFHLNLSPGSRRIPKALQGLQ
jgi:hypothetical protein